MNIMKPIASFFILLCSTYSLSQEINQLDSNGLRQGAWKKNFKSSKSIRYEGQFEHGKEVGLFKFYKYVDEQSILSATKKFNDSNNIAEVRFYSSKGKLISEGTMKGKTFIGPWKYYHKNSDNLMRIEQYGNEGLQQGELLVYFENGTEAERSLYKDGKLYGKSYLYNENGIKIKEFYYSNDVLNGPSKFYTTSGQILIEGSYKNGKKHGIWKYYEKGKLKEEKDFTRRSKNPYKKE